MNRRIAFSLRLIVLCGLALLAAACSPFKYAIEVVNYGTHGVIIRHAQFVGDNGDIRGSWKIWPGIPGVADDFVDFQNFIDHPHSLPEELAITWHLAKLSDCESTVSSKGFSDYDDKVHTRKLGCIWTPIKDKVFHQRVDMAAIRASEAYQRVGEPSPVNSPYSLVIQFIFNEDSLTVKVTNDYRLFN